MPRTDWTRLYRYLREKNLEPGTCVKLTAVELQGILSVDALPRFASRVTAWDPVMGKPGGLQRVMKDLNMIPVAFEWQGPHSARPVLTSVTLMKWGRVC